MENPLNAALVVPRSPYAIFENESVVPEEQKAAITEDELKYLFRNNFIRETERTILYAVSRLKLMNIKQISDWLDIHSLHFEKASLEAILKKLTAKGFITRIIISRKDTDMVRYEYVLGRSATFMPEYRTYKLIDPSNINIADVKSMLAANQFILCVLKDNKAANFDIGGVVKTQGSFFSPSKSFTYNAMIELESAPLYVMVVRRNNGWESELESLLPACKQFLKENRAARLVVICEDANHKECIENMLRNLSVTVVHDRELHQKGFNSLALV